MFESFVIVLREGIEAALVVGITLVVLRRSGRRELERPVFWGLGLAVLASLAAAWGLQRLPLNEEVYEGVLYWVSAVFVSTMLWWMHRHARQLRADIEGRAGLAASRSDRGARGAALALGAFVFLMVFREGAETVLFLAAVQLTTQGVLAFLGGAVGLALAVAFAVLFVRGSIHVDLRRFFRVTEWILAIFIAQLVVNGYHELSEAGWVPATRTTMALIGPVVRNDALFVLALVALPLFIWLSRTAPADTGAVPAGSAQARLVLATARRERSYSLGAAAATVVVLASVGYLWAKESMPAARPTADQVRVEDGQAVVALAVLDDGRLHHFEVSLDGRAVRFLAMKTGEGRYHAALDACEICGPKGYLQEGENLLCLNCAAEIDPATLGVSGGCNPIPLEAAVAGGALRVSVATLETASAGLSSQAPGGPAPDGMPR